MAGGKLGFWSASFNVMIAFLLSILVIIMMAKLVNSSFYSQTNQTKEHIAANLAPVGKVYYRKG